MDERSNTDIPNRKRQKRPKTVTKKRQSDSRIHQNEEFQSIFDRIPEAIIITNAKGRIIYLNTDAKTLFGEQAEILESEEEWPRNFGLYLDDGIVAYPEHELPWELALQGETVQEEELILRKEGESDGIWITITSQPLQLSGEHIEGTITFIRDISYRKQIEFSREKHVRRTEALYRLSHRITEAGNNLKKLSQALAKFTSEVIGDLSVIVLKDGDDSEMKIAAFSDSNPTGNALIRKLLVHGDQFEADRSVEGGVIKSGEPLLIPSIDPEQIKAITIPAFKDFIDQVGLESVLVVPLSGRGGVLGTISLFRHRGGNAFKMEDQSFLMDIASRAALAIENCRLFDSLRSEIAERLSTEKKLDTSEERFRAIFESTTLGIKVLDLNGNIMQTNKAFQEMIGYSEVELFGRHFSEFIHEADVPQALNLIQDLKVTGATQYRFEHRDVCKDDTLLWVKTTFSPVRKSNGNKELAYIVGIIENISEQKRTEHEMGELRDRLQSNIERERLRLAQELHDNPMQALHSVMYRIAELRSKVDTQMAEELEQVTSEIKMILDDLRTTAKELRPPTIFDFGLENAIRSYTDDFLEKNPNLSVSLSLAQDRQMLPEEMRLALFRVFQQALTNVMRHSEATEVTVRFAFDAEEVCLEVADNGKGFEVPPNWIGFVREGHYGLAGASERVSALGGVFKVESRPGNTTRVIVTIPWEGP